MRIIFDLDGTLVGRFEEGYRLNRPLLEIAAELSRSGHEAVLWTFGNRDWWRTVRAWWPELSSVFREVYTRNDGLRHITRAGPDVQEPVKDIRKIGGDLLIDNNPAHKLWARRHGLSEQYVLIENFGIG